MSEIFQHHVQSSATGPPEGWTATGSYESRSRSRLDTLAAVIIAITAVAIAWSAYQSTRWGGEMSVDFSKANTQRSESIRLTSVAGQAVLADIILLTNWIYSIDSGDLQVAEDLRVRMSDEFSTAMDAWLVSWSPGQPLPPGSPFETDGYKAPYVDEGAQRTQEADADFAGALHANQHSDNYMLATVVFATTLLFAGIASRFESMQAVRLLLGLGVVFMLLGFGFLLLQPVTVSV